MPVNNTSFWWVPVTPPWVYWVWPETQAWPIQGDNYNTGYLRGDGPRTRPWPSQTGNYNTKLLRGDWPQPQSWLIQRENHYTSHLWGRHLQQPHNYENHQQRNKQYDHYLKNRIRQGVEEVLSDQKTSTVQGLGRYNNGSKHKIHRNQRYSYARTTANLRPIPRLTEKKT